MFLHRYLPPENSLSKVSIVANASQLTASGVTLILLMDTVLNIDSDTFTYNTGTGILTLLRTGYYNVHVNLAWQTSSTSGIRLGSVSLTDGGVVKRSDNTITPRIGGFHYNYASALIKVTNANSPIDFRAYQDSGISLSVIGIVGGANSTFINAVRIGDL